MMRTTIRFLALASIVALAFGAMGGEVRRISVKEYVNKMKAGWVGQMAGVGWAAPTEFKFNGRIIPENKVPKWHPQKINQFRQDDIYVEMTFLRTLEVHGLDCTIRQAGIDFANSGYRLWHANKCGRDNLRRGIAPPDSGHPKYNKCADDIDYQIEADYSGLISPGLPNAVVALGEKFGRLMNYGDGLYGGQFVGAMYAEAFFEKDIRKIILAGLAAVPKGSQFHECISDVLKWHAENPRDWRKTWQLIEDKYQKNTAYRRASCKGPKSAFNIDAKINAAYIIMGMVYGERDPDKTIVISMRCGQDSDCNPSNAAGVLFTTIGYDELPKRFTSALNPKSKFSHTPYSFPKLCEVCEMLARKIVVAQGGKIEKDGDGKEVFEIPVQATKPSKLEQCWEPGPPAESTFTEEEMAKIGSAFNIKGAVSKFAPGWSVAKCGPDMKPGLRGEWRGRKKVLVTHPLSKGTACVLSKKVAVPAGKKTALKLAVSHHPNADWTLVVKADDKALLTKKIGKETCRAGWADLSVDLSPFAGKTIKLALENKADGWSSEAGYWGQIAVVSE